jgi:hypothetical protein
MPGSSRQLRRCPYAMGGALLLGVAGVLGGCEWWGLSGSGREARPLPVSQVLGEVGSSPGQFLYPRALTAQEGGAGLAGRGSRGPGGQLWVIDKAGRIQSLDPQTGRASVMFRAPETALGRPCGIATGPGTRGAGPFLYIADTHYHRVLIYQPHPVPVGASPATLAPEPTLVAQFGSYGTGDGQFIYLTDVAILKDDQGRARRLYVGEYGGNDRISIWEPGSEGPESWRFVSAFGSLGDDDAPGNIQFDRPQSLAVDQARGWLVVTDACNHRVGVFTLEGNLVRWHGSPATAGSAPEQMAYPFGLVLLEDGSALVTEFGNHRVRHMDLQTGEVLGLYGSGGRGRGELLNPWAVTVLEGLVYVLDSGNERIQAFSLPGRRRLAGGGLP